MRRQNGVSLVEIAMVVVVISIIAVVALPVIGTTAKTAQVTKTQVINNIDSIRKVKSAYAIAIAEKGDYPRLGNVVALIDADFAYETSDLSGILFRDGKQRLTVKTFSDIGCLILTSNKNPGVSDIVRCI